MTLRRAASRLVGASLALLLGTAPVSAAPASPANHPAITAVAAPQGLFAGTLSFQVTSVTPSVINGSSGNVLAVRGAVTNTSDKPVTELIYRWQRGDRLADAAAVSSEVEDPGQPTAVIADDWHDLGERIGPGESAPFALATTVAGRGAGSLRITEPGVYPLMVNVNGITDVDGTPTAVRLGELHLLVTVTSIPGATVVHPATTAPVPVGFLWPLTSRPHRGVGGVFLDDELATAVGPDGPLTQRLDALVDADLPPGSVTLVVDPMLLDELDDMRTGYRVQQPGVAQTPVTTAPLPPKQPPTSSAPDDDRTAPSETEDTATAGRGTVATQEPDATTGTSATSAAPSTSASSPAPQTRTANPPPHTIAGTGADAAAAFLQRVRDLAASYPVLLLPYSDPDAVALTRSGHGKRLAALAERGRRIGAEVLGDSTIDTVAVPPDALAGGRALDSYRAAGYAAVVLSGDAVEQPRAEGRGVVTTANGHDLPAVFDDSALQEKFSAVLAPAGGGTGARALNAAVAVVAQRSFDGDDRPLLRLPDTIIDTGGLDALGAAIRGLARDGAVVPATPQTLLADFHADDAARRLTVHFPDRAAGRLLPADYLRALDQRRSRLATLRRALDVAGDADAPATATAGAAEGVAVVDTLIDALLPLTSVSLRSDDARNHATAVLSTVQASTEALRSGVTIRSSLGSYTLASSDSPLVLTLQNSLPYPVRVHLRIIGGAQVGLQTTEPDSVLIAADSARQVTIPATVSRAGVFTVRAQLFGPGNAAWSDPVTLRIRSNAYGAVTIILIVAAGAVLLLMVAWRIGQRWRARQQRLAAARAADTSDIL